MATKKLLQVLTIAMFALTVGTIASIPPAVHAAGFTVPPPPTGISQTPLDSAIINFLNAALILVGIVALIAVIVSGVFYITSGGDEDQASRAKSALLYSIIGLIVVGLSWAIVAFFIGTFS